VTSLLAGAVGAIAIAGAIAVSAGAASGFA
jgi:hypothetical protein